MGLDSVLQASSLLIKGPLVESCRLGLFEVLLGCHQLGMARRIEGLGKVCLTLGQIHWIRVRLLNISPLTGLHVCWRGLRATLTSSSCGPACRCCPPRGESFAAEGTLPGTPCLPDPTRAIRSATNNIPTLLLLGLLLLPTLLLLLTPLLLLLRHTSSLPSRLLRPLQLIRRARREGEAERIVQLARRRRPDTNGGRPTAHAGWG